MRSALATLVVLLLAIQLVPVDRTNPPGTGTLAGVPPAVAEGLQRACYDCHSNETAWPWYSRIAPVSWLVAHDVEEGRKHLNFSTWTALPEKKRAKALEEIVEVLDEDEMPLWLYDLAHPGVRLDAASREAILAWARAGS